jgi:hypothetical protein
MTTLKYIKQKRLKQAIDKAQKRKAVLKQQIKVIDGKPTERPVLKHRIWRDMMTGFVAGGAAGAIVAATNDAGIGMQALAAFGGAELGGLAAFTGHLVYTCKPFSNAFNRYSKKHKINTIAKLDNKVADSKKQLDEIEREM